MRGRCAALATADLTWTSLNTLHEHTIINQFHSSSRTKSEMNNTRSSRRQDRRKPRETFRRGSDVGPVWASEDQQSIGMQNEPASVVSSSSPGAAMRLS